MTCATPKTYQNQKFFWIPSKQPPNTCRAGSAIFFHQKHVYLKHPTLHLNFFLSFYFLLLLLVMILEPDSCCLYDW